MRNHDQVPTPPAAARRAQSRRIASAALLAPALLLVGAAPSQDARSAEAARAARDPAETSARIEETREMIERWVETRRVLSDEMRDWALGKDMLVSRAEVLRGEVGEAEGRTAEAGKSVTEADRKAADLVARNDALKASAAELSTLAATLETRVKELVRRLPDPIRDKLRPLISRLPEDPAASELALSTRFQNVVGIVNEVNKFSKEITVTSEVRRLPDGTSAEVTSVYLGVAQGYYVGGGGRLAGVGGAGDAGWTWTPANEHAPQIAKVVAILKNEAPAEFVPVPLGVR